MYHYRQTRKRYNQHNRADKGCTFCDPTAPHKFILETEYNYVIENRVPYDTWELHDVTEHLLVVPKRHVDSLDHMTDVELLDAMRICAEYEAKDYNVYARSIESPRRSVRHQHTHLIKIDRRPARASFFLKKPYLLIKF